MRLAIISIIAALAACTDAKTVVDPDATALEIVVEVAPGLGIDRLQLSAVGGEFTAGTVPEIPRLLEGAQSVVVLLSEALDGSELIVRVDGLAGTELAASGGARATVRARSLERVVIALGEPAICGDGRTAPLIEPCDDGGFDLEDGCSATCAVEPGFRCTAAPNAPSVCRPDTFDVALAASAGHRLLAVTFSAPPDPVQALALASYSVPGLTLSGQPFLEGNVVRLATSAQDPINYNVIVTGVARAKDALPLTNPVGGFAGRTAFNLMSARSTSATQMRLTFSEPPDPATATALANYAVPTLTLAGTPVVNGVDVTVTTSLQVATVYTVNVTGVLRAGDTEPLELDDAAFTGVNGFDVTSAASAGSRRLMVTFNAPPNAVQAATLANYAVAGLALTGTPVVDGNTVTLATAAQAAMPYTVVVSNVTRAADAALLTIGDAAFTGLAPAAPSVLLVEVLSTAPDNGTTFYNSGTAIVRLTGTQFTTVVCPGGVRLDDRDGAGGVVNTQATSCSVDSDTQITATFPAGVRTNGDVGWPVMVTNDIGSNAASDGLVVRAGLLISEIRAPGNAHEFVELYNPTATAIDVTPLQLHFRRKNGNDTVKPLTLLRSSIPAHGFFLLSSSQSTSADPWFDVRDATYNASNNAIESNGSVYISAGMVAQVRVLDKVGWGMQSAGGFEGTALPNIANNTSVERKPAGGAGHAIDTDNNANDFNAATTTPTPRGALSPAEP